MLTMRQFLVFFSLSITGSSMWYSPAQSADKWPDDRAIHLVIPFDPGGLVDVMGRVIGQKLSESLHQTVVVENRAGAAGIIGSTQVMRAAPDGYTLLIASLASHIVAPAATEKRPYDPLTDFTHIAFLGGPPLVIAVSNQSNFESLSDMMAAAKKGEVNAYASSGFGTTGHIIMEQLSRKNGVLIPHVPFNTASLTDIIAGRISVGIYSYGAAAPVAEAGLIKLVAITAAERLEIAPKVPTLKELGYDIEMTSWASLAAPKGIPANIRETLHSAVSAIITDASVTSRFAKDGVVVRVMTTEELADLYRSQARIWEPITRELVSQREPTAAP